MEIDKSSKEYYANYGYKSPKESISIINRPEYKYIVKWIKPNSKVLDLGCGDGSLGALLIEDKGCEVWGIDVSENGVAQSCQKGIKAEIGDMDMGLKYPDKSFDYVIINVTLQMVYRPGYVLKESLRVGKQIIISFPNFGLFLTRLEVLFCGRFPRIPLYSHHWYDTRHIHLFSYKDFKRYLKEIGAKIRAKEFLCYNSKDKCLLSDLFPNFFSGICILLIEEDSLL